MNEQMKDPENKNPWSDRESLPTVSPRHTALAALACLICALALPFCGNEWVSLGVLAVLFAYVALEVRSPISVTIVLTTAVAAVTLSGGIFASGALFMAFAVGTVTCAYLITVLRVPFLPMLLPIAACGISYLLSGNLYVSLLALAFLPAAALLAFATLHASNRTTAICYTVAGLLIPLVAALLLTIYQAYGHIGRSAVIGFIDSAKAGAIDAMMLMKNELLSMMPQEALNAETIAAYDQMIVTVTDVTFNVLPALAVVACSIVAYEAQGMLNAIYYRTGLRAAVTPNAQIFTMSMVAAVLYVLSFILTVTLPTTSIVSGVVQNLCLMLLPGFFVLGVQGVLLSLAQAKGGMRVLMLILFGSLLCCFTGGLLYFIAMWGAYGRLMYTIRQKLMEKMNSNKNDSES